MIDLRPDREQRRMLLAKTAELVQTKLFDPNLCGVQWADLVESRKDRILDAEEFSEEMADLLAQLGCSPTAFFHVSEKMQPAGRLLSATFYEATTADGPRWMLQDVHLDGVADKAGLVPGCVLLTVNGMEKRPPEKLDINPRVETVMRFSDRSGRIRSTTVTASIHRSNSDKKEKIRYVHCERREGRIGYLKISMFPGLLGIDVARDIDHAVRQLKDCDRLIIDLRGNPGGGTANLRLMSYLTPEKIPVGYSLTRPRAEAGYKREDLVRFGRIPRTKLALPWLALRFKYVDKSIVVVTEGRGRWNFHTRVVLLVNEHTASGSEIVAGFAADHKLATTVGNRTAGRLLGWSSFPVADGYIAVIPVSSYVTWEGKHFEGKGITPDVEVPFSSRAAIEGVDVQLERAIEILSRA